MCREPHQAQAVFSLGNTLFVNRMVGSQPCCVWTKHSVLNCVSFRFFFFLRLDCLKPFPFQVRRSQVPGTKTVINEYNVQSVILHTGLAIINPMHMDLLMALCQKAGQESR